MLQSCPPINGVAFSLSCHCGFFRCTWQLLICTAASFGLPLLFVPRVPPPVHVSSTEESLHSHWLRTRRASSLLFVVFIHLSSCRVHAQALVSLVASWPPFVQHALPLVKILSRRAFGDNGVQEGDCPAELFVFRFFLLFRWKWCRHPRL